MKDDQVIEKIDAILAVSEAEFERQVRALLAKGETMGFTAMSVTWTCGLVQHERTFYQELPELVVVDFADVEDGVV